MITQEYLKEELDNCLEYASIAMLTKDFVRPNLHIREEIINFDLDKFLLEWSKERNVNFVSVDIANISQTDILALPKILKVPTVFLLKNFGDYSKDDERWHYRQLVKDCVLIHRGMVTEANNFLFAVATTTKDNPIRDSSENNCFGYLGIELYLGNG